MAPKHKNAVFEVGSSERFRDTRLVSKSVNLFLVASGVEKMMKTAFSVACFAFGVLTASIASAVTIAPTASSGIIAGNDSQPGGFALLTSWVDSLGLYEAGFALFELAKVDEPATTDGDLSVRYDGGAPSSSGSWDWSGSDAIEFVVYKAGPEFVAHYFDPGIFGNMWDTADPNIGLLGGSGGREISHITVYGVDGTRISAPPPPVPLPAGGLLLVTAMGGAFVLRMRKKTQ